LFSFTRNSITAHQQNDTSFIATLSHWIIGKYWCTHAGPVFQIAENKYIYWPYNLKSPYVNKAYTN
jgi:hypothetical protein